ncbi:GAL4 like protein [Aspergillus parasiticus SU-1]|uniref:GAL4 like protein n=1 Tax=Aspergillus parasiticus (strain ATCC 56775 / NRRL 5862 / SRRC 143 / SU-1) TaxID=1403190 RepID=A0A0F0IAL6_ASPPU|nr:GAL4 like protein [Aspergillus parasiticus SU-1]
MSRRQSSRRHACFRCIELKVKCSTQGNDKECQRCSRLGRPCVFPSTLPNNPGRKSRIDELQDQINELRDQLTKRDEGASGHGISGDEAVPHALQQHNAPIEHTKSISPRPALGEPGDLLTIGILTLAQCNRLLDKFRMVKMPQFPFVIIPDSMNAISLRQEYPFLFVAIMTVSTEDRPSLQKDLNHEVKRTISTRIIMNNERNIDLLLGLLVYTAWYHYHWESMLPHMYLFLQLTITMVADLGLDRQPNFTMQNIAASLGRPSSARQLVANHSAAGKRALLGTFYLCSVSSLFRQQLFMEYTDWINQCCDDLRKNSEFPSDQHLKTYIDVRLLAQKSAEVFNGKVHSHAHPPLNGRERLESGIQELDKEFTLFQGIKDEAREHGSDTYAYVFEVKVKPVIILGQIVYHRNDAFLLDEMDQLDSLISSSESFITSFLETLTEIAIHLPLSFYTYLWYALLVLSKVLLLSDLEWERTTRLGRRIHGIARAAIEKHGELSSGNDVWANSKRVIGSMISWLQKHQDLRGPEQRLRNHPSSTMHHLTVVDENTQYPSASTGSKSTEPGRKFTFPTQQPDPDQVVTEFTFDQIDLEDHIGNHALDVATVNVAGSKPTCSGCLRHSVQCDYQLENSSSNVSTATGNVKVQPAATAPRKVSTKRHQTFISSYQTNFKPPKRAHRTRKSISAQLLPFSSSKRIFPTFSCRPFEFTIIDMELFHNSLNPTDYGESEHHSAIRMQRNHLSHLGFSFPYVLRLLLAGSGFQLARRPEVMQLQQSAIQGRDYYVVAERHYNLAIREVVAVVPRLNKENCHAIYTAAVHIFVCSLAMGPRPGEYMASRDDDVVLKGDEGESGSESEPAAETTGSARSSTIASEYGYWMGQLRHLIKSELVREDTPYSVYHAVLERLHQCYDAIYGPFSPVMTALLSPCIFGWLYRLPDAFMFGLRQRHQPALVIFSYFVVLLDELTWNWFLQDWPRHILIGIHRNLDIYHQQYIQWPMHCVAAKV